jgi:hypothetical protein
LDGKEGNLSLSFDTPLSIGGSYTFLMASDGNGLYPPSNASVKSAIAGSLSDQLSSVIVTSTSNPLSPLTYNISFTFTGDQGTQVQDLANALNDLLSSSVAVSLVFESAVGGATVPGGSTGGGAPQPTATPWTTYALYAFAAVVVGIVAFGFSKGFGEGAAADI